MFLWNRNKLLSQFKLGEETAVIIVTMNDGTIYSFDATGLSKEDVKAYRSMMEAKSDVASTGYIKPQYIEEK